ncbi:hypothetical protein ACTWKB_17055 [Bacillus sp. 4A_MP2]
MIGRQDWIETLEKMFSAFYVDVSSYPSGHTAFLQGLLSQYAAKREIIILGKRVIRKKNSFYKHCKNDSCHLISF